MFNERVLKRQLLKVTCHQFPRGSRRYFCRFELGISTFLSQPRLDTPASPAAAAGPSPCGQTPPPPSPGPAVPPPPPAQRGPSPARRCSRPPRGAKTTGLLPPCLPSGPLSNRFLRAPRLPGADTQRFTTANDPFAGPPTLRTPPPRPGAPRASCPPGDTPPPLPHSPRIRGGRAGLAGPGPPQRGKGRPAQSRPGRAANGSNRPRSRRPPAAPRVSVSAGYQATRPVTARPGPARPRGGKAEAGGRAASLAPLLRRALRGAGGEGGAVEFGEFVVPRRRYGKKKTNCWA